MAGCARDVARTRELYGQIEMIIGIVRIRIDCFLKVFGRGSSVGARADHSQVVVNLGERQPGGNEAECRVRAGKISLVVGGEPKIKICLPRERIVFGDVRQPGNRLLVLPFTIIGLAQLQECLRVGRIEANRFAKVLNLLLGGGRRNSTDIAGAPIADLQTFQTAGKLAG